MEEGHQTLALSQEDEKLFPKDSKFQYSNVRMIVMQEPLDLVRKPVTSESNTFLSSELKFIEGTKGFQERDTYIELKKLKKGKYYVFVEIDWDSWTQHKKYRNFTLNCYGAGETQFNLCQIPSSVPQ